MNRGLRLALRSHRGHRLDKVVHFFQAPPVPDGPSSLSQSLNLDLKSLFSYMVSLRKVEFGLEDGVVLAVYVRDCHLLRTASQP